MTAAVAGAVAPRYGSWVSMTRGTTLAGRLAVLGFADTARAERMLTEDLRLDVGGRDAELVDAIAGGADPDLALTALARLPLDRELRAALRTDAALRDRLIAVLGASAALGEHLVRHPDHWRVLAGPGLLSRPTAAELRAELLAAAGVQGQADAAAGADRAAAGADGAAPAAAGGSAAGADGAAAEADGAAAGAAAWGRRTGPWRAHAVRPGRKTR